MHLREILPNDIYLENTSFRIVWRRVGVARYQDENPLLSRNVNRDIELCKG